MDTEQFIRLFSSEDVRSLALKADKFPSVDITYALNQISGRQAALKKLPALHALDGIIYPPHLSIEQCSSEFTAKYKRHILQRAVGEDYTLIDLTGGFGVDFIYMSENCSHAVYVERNTDLCDIVKHNLSVLGRDNADVINADVEEYSDSLGQYDIIYADPARRDSAGGRTYAISDCTPDVLKLLPRLLESARYVLIKLSPMLDHNKTVQDLNKVCKCVQEVHIVSVSGECKELLVLLSKDVQETYTVSCINDSDEFTFRPSDIHRQPNIHMSDDLSGMYLYEPNASIMKAGCFAELSERYNISAIAYNSNIFVSREKIDGFPGRSFNIVQTTTMNKKELSRNLNSISRANITVRNFPMNVSALRKRLKLIDGGDTYIFATTTYSGAHVLLLCEKF